MLDKLEIGLKNRGFTRKTIASYLFHNQEFLKFINKAPEEINETDVKNYLDYLTLERKYKPRSINLAFSSLKFFYSGLLDKKIMKNVKVPKPDKKEPTILTREEISSLLNVTKNPKHKLLLNLMLTSGLKVSEVVSIKLEDINPNEKLLTVRTTNGEKDRLTTLSDQAVLEIKKLLSTRKDNNPYLFAVRDSHVTIKLPQKIIKQSAKKARLDKRVFCHALRSTFIQTLIDNNIDLTTIKELVGNESFDVNIYSPLYIEKIKKIKNPFDKD